MTFNTALLLGRRARVIGTRAMAHIVGADGATPATCTVVLVPEEGWPPVELPLSAVAVNDGPEPLPLGAGEWRRRQAAREASRRA
jgi:hypothetical protein